jgi:hypothetical protein
VKVYVAGFFDSQARLKETALRLADLGYEITSTWLDEVPTPDPDEHYLNMCAIRDLEDIKRSDAVILDTQDINPRGGREVEWGVALTRMIPRYIVGPSRNVFHRLATLHFTTWESALDHFAAMAKRSA